MCLCAKASDHAVGEENPADARDSLCHRFRHWTGRHTNHEGRDSPHGGECISVFVKVTSKCGFSLKCYVLYVSRFVMLN